MRFQVSNVHLPTVTIRAVPADAVYFQEFQKIPFCDSSYYIA